MTSHPGMELPETPLLIDGGYCVRRLPDGRCVDVLKMLYNWRVVLTRRDPITDEHEVYERGYCYFGHGEDSSGRPRDMETAFLTAMSAAAVWGGEGDPSGFDKIAGQ